MTKTKKRISEGEIIKRRNSRKVYIPFYLMVLILVAISVVIYLNGLPINTFTLIAIILFILFGFKFTELHRLNNLYEITPIAFIHTNGLLSKKVKRGDYFAIRNIDIKQTAWQRMLGFGDVIVDMFSELIPVRNINDPNGFAEVLEEESIIKRRSATKSGKMEVLRDAESRAS